jgi:large subunit ribosomal protein L3
MAIGLLGRKVGMTQVYDDLGNVVPVTVLEAGPCHVLQVRSQSGDGYEAVQIGYEDKPRRLAPRSERGHVARLESKRSKHRSSSGVDAVAKANCEPKQFVREFRGAAANVEVGQQLTVELFAETKAVDVVGTSKGRGTSGVMKRHNFHGQRASHGVKKCHRHAGGTGCSATPSRTIKGRRMAGRYGGSRSTSRNLKVVRVDSANNLLLVRGAVPGPNGSFVMIRETNKL